MEKIYYRVADRPESQIEAFKNRYALVWESEIKDVFESLGYKVFGIEKSRSWWTSHIIYYVETRKNWEEKTLVFRGNSWEKWGFQKPEVIMLWEKLVTDLVLSTWVVTNRILQVDISRKEVPFDYQIEEKLFWIDPEIYIDENGNFLGWQKNYDKMSFELWQAIAKYSSLEFEKFWLPEETEILKWKIVWTCNTFYEYIYINLHSHLMYLLAKWTISKEEFVKVLCIFKTNKVVINNCKPSLVHHDLADHNLTYDTLENWLWAIFDWEAMVLWDSMLDLWSCPTWNTHFPRKELLIKWYASIKPLPVDYELRMNLYELRTRIWKMKFLVQLNNLKEPVEPQVKAFKDLLNKF
jgi:hypothetical protein